MTALYAYQWPVPLMDPVAQLDPLAARLHWSHSIISERDFLSEWRAIELASDVATDLGFSAELRTDAFALPLRKKMVLNKVSFDPTVQVFLGLDSDIEFPAVRVHHETLASWPDNLGIFMLFVKKMTRPLSWPDVLGLLEGASQHQPHPPL